MPRISVIVPVYKVEKYLHECVDSILAQTFEDFELILVDDGSPDNCGAICDEYAEKDPRVRVIHQENQGVSAARNAALDAAKGEFIAFIDSDDMVSSHYLEILMQAMAENVDIIFCRIKLFEDGVNPPINEEVGNNLWEKHTPQSAVLALHDGSRGFLVGPWSKLYRSKVIDSFRFPVGKIHEDQAFVPIVCYQAREIVACSAALYYYRQQSDSITRTRFSLKRYDDIWAIDTCIEYFDSKHEHAIVDVLKQKRRYRLAAYTIYAWRDKVTVPMEYKVGLLQAIWYLYKHAPESYFEYYLGQLHPQLAVIHAYWRKIKSLF